MKANLPHWAEFEILRNVALGVHIVSLTTSTFSDMNLSYQVEMLS